MKKNSKILAKLDESPTVLVGEDNTQKIGAY
jgi:hypothetical protein